MSTKLIGTFLNQLLCSDHEPAAHVNNFRHNILGLTVVLDSDPWLKRFPVIPLDSLQIIPPHTPL